MKLVLVSLLSALAMLGQSADLASDAALQDQTDGGQSTDLNVNSRYTVESIDFDDAKPYKLSGSVVDEMQRLIGARLNSDALNRLAELIRHELRAHDVTFTLARGIQPNSIKVLLDVEKGGAQFDVSFPKFVYNSRQGWTGVGEASASLGPNVLTVGLLSDGDTLVERAQGVKARYDRLSLATDRVQLGFEFDAYHDEYNRATRIAIDNGPTSSLGAGAYSSRLNFEPSATFVLSKPFTVSVGLSFEQLQTGVASAPWESANAVVSTLRYHQQQESDSSIEEVDAGYTLRAGTRILNSDLGYTRHLAHAKYGYKHNRQSVEVKLVAGVIYGRAPLFERFVLGDSTTLRGWNKYDLDPLGGNRMLYGSVTYGYRVMRVFYDTGSIWDQGKSPEDKHSAGIGVSSGLGLFQKSAFLLAVAFPIREGRPDPMLIAGMNF